MLARPMTGHTQVSMGSAGDVAEGTAEESRNLCGVWSIGQLIATHPIRHRRVTLDMGKLPGLVMAPQDVIGINMNID